MSATGRSDVRKPHDNYSTPDWCLRRLLEQLQLPSGNWLEPCAGDGALIKAVAQLQTRDAPHAAQSPSVSWTAIELREECEKPLAAAVGTNGSVHILDFLDPEVDIDPEKYAVIITNPPFSRAMEFIKKCVDKARYVVMLQRVNFLASQERHDFFVEHMPDIYLIPDRPSFTNDGKTDSTEYAWYVWVRGVHSRASSLVMLDLTPASERGKKARARKSVEEQIVGELKEAIG